ncbi:hypothetical protein [Caproicibacterium sp. XB2]
MKSASPAETKVLERSLPTRERGLKLFVIVVLKTFGGRSLHGSVD